MRTAPGDLSRDPDVLLDNLLRRLPVIVFAADTDGVCTYSEGSALGALGLSGGQRVGVNLFETNADRPRETARESSAVHAVSCPQVWAARGPRGIRNSESGIEAAETLELISEKVEA